MKYTVHLPAEPLRDYVDHLWTIASDDKVPFYLSLKFFVTCGPCIVFQHRNGHSTIERRVPTGEVCNTNHPTSFIRGAITRPFQCVAIGPEIAVGVELKPNALGSLFGIDAAELADGMVNLNDFSRENLNERLLNAASERDQIAIVTDFLLRKADEPRRADLLVAESLRWIHGNPGLIHVRDLLKRLRISERQFERRFRRAIGIPASLYLRIVRLEEAMRLMRAGRLDKLSDVAYELGYTDQSHFIKDTKEFTRYPPKSLSKAIDACGRMTAYRTLVRQRILIQQCGKYLDRSRESKNTQQFQGM